MFFRDKSAMKYPRMPLLFALVVMGGTGQVKADLITYRDQVTATGTLGLSSFTNALVTILVTGDTGSVQQSGSGVQLLFNLGDVFVTIEGLGTAVLSTTGGEAFTDLNGPGGSARCGIAATGGSILDTGNALCSTYDLKTPITLTGPSFVGRALTYDTDLGAFHMSSVANTSTFTATVVPEPSSIALTGFIIMTLFAGFRRPRRSKTQTQKVAPISAFPSS